MTYYFFALLFACCLYAFVAGGAPERLGAAAYALACIASPFAFSPLPVQYHSVETGVFIVDVLVFVAFIILALRANRFWPIWVSALLGLGVLAHLARWTGPSAVPWAYQFIMSVWSYPILAIIALGTWRHQQRLTRNGVDPSWSNSSANPTPTPTPRPKD